MKENISAVKREKASKVNTAYVRFEAIDRRLLAGLDTRATWIPPFNERRVSASTAEGRDKTVLADRIQEILRKVSYGPSPGQSVEIRQYRWLATAAKSPLWKGRPGRAGILEASITTDHLGTKECL
jgi:hypothetical protein